LYDIYFILYNCIYLILNLNIQKKFFFLNKSYPTSHPFASLKGSDNIIAFTTERFVNPLIIIGAGAGDAVTAFGIFSDVLQIYGRVTYGR